jgi:glycosidase
MAMRTITPQGTINAAAELLPYVASLNFEYVYILPLCEADRDMDVRTWSWDCINNPACPYKSVDFFNVDSEYGTNENFKSFITKAHECGLKVMIDLVYLHCGRNVYHLKDDPDFLVRDENGEIPLGGTWPFARINFENENAREYLWSNMLYYVKECGADGFRCDCGDMVPVDFWEEGIKRVREVNPDILMINEGYNRDTLNYGFDMIYTDNTQITDPNSLDLIKGKISVKEWKEKLLEPFSMEGKFIRFVENHDTASVAMIKRLETLVGRDKMEAYITLCFTLNGVPFIWNGNEICDDSMTLIMGNRFFPGTNSINWAYAQTEKGKRRLKIVKALNDLREKYPELQTCDIKLIESDEDVIYYKRCFDDKIITVIINFGNEDYKTTDNDIKTSIISNKTSIEEGQIIIEKNGYIVFEN